MDWYITLFFCCWCRIYCHNASSDVFWEGYYFCFAEIPSKTFSICLIEGTSLLRKKALQEGCVWEKKWTECININEEIDSSVDSFYLTIHKNLEPPVMKSSFKWRKRTFEHLRRKIINNGVKWDDLTWNWCKRVTIHKPSYHLHYIQLWKRLVNPYQPLFLLPLKLLTQKSAAYHVPEKPENAKSFVLTESVSILRIYGSFLL